MSRIIVYGSLDCEDTVASRKVMDTLGLPYEFVDVDADSSAEAEATRLNNGKLKTPTIVFASGEPVLVEPSDEELLRELARRNLVQVN